MQLTELIELIKELEPEEFVAQHILNGACPHFSEVQIEHVREVITEATGINIARNEIHVVGSAKLGFGLFEKKRRDMPALPAFRHFGPDSDVDIAFSSPHLFDQIWTELSSFAVQQPWLPHNMGKLGDYMIYGWLRPDHFPKGERFHLYDRWNDRIRGLPKDGLMARRKISGALYRDINFISRYQARGIKSCKRSLEAQ